MSWKFHGGEITVEPQRCFGCGVLHHDQVSALVALAVGLGNTMPGVLLMMLLRCHANNGMSASGLRQVCMLMSKHIAAREY